MPFKRVAPWPAHTLLPDIGLAAAHAKVGVQTMHSTVLNYLIAFLFVALVIYAMISDVRHLKIPNRISLGLIALFALYFAVNSPDLVRLQSHLVHAGIVFAVGFLLFAVGWLAAGDVKLLTAITLWLEPQQLAHFVVTTAFIGGILALAVLVLRNGLRKDTSGWAGRLSGLLAPLRPILPRWVHVGLVPYGVAIGLGALLNVPSVFF